MKYLKETERTTSAEASVVVRHPVVSRTVAGMVGRSAEDGSTIISSSFLEKTYFIPVEYID